MHKVAARSNGNRAQTKYAKYEFARFRGCEKNDRANEEIRENNWKSEKYPFKNNFGMWWWRRKNDTP